MSQSPPSPAPIAPRRAFREVDEGYLGGVAAGLAEHLRLPVTWVRLAFIVASAFGGFGIAAYAGLWLMLPAAPHFADEAPGLAAASRQGKRPDRQSALRDLGVLIPFAAIAVGILLLLGQVTGQGPRLWPLLLIGGAVAILWRQGDEAQRERWRTSGFVRGPWDLIVGGGGWRSTARLVAGVALLLTGIGLFALRGGSVSVAADALVAAMLAVIGVLVMLGPWLYRLSSDLTEERAERIRSQERADVAAHLHDSVLQTLALIQNSAHDPARVGQLARSQERDLRSWLYAEARQCADTLAAGLRLAGAQVEDSLGVPVEVVNVGDLPLDESLQPLLAAAGEAMTNAAKHSGAAKIDVYAEVAGASVSVFVRDRGAGFDPEAIAADRHGVSDSILARMDRHGGRAEVRSAPGEGTEIRLFLDLKGTP